MFPTENFTIIIGRKFLVIGQITNPPFMQVTIVSAEILTFDDIRTVGRRSFICICKFRPEILSNFSLMI